MRIVFSGHAWEEYLWWQTQDAKILQRVNTLIKENSRIPSASIGKSEPLRAELSGWWSRRITQEHRLVYRVSDSSLQIAQCRYHY